MEMRAIHTSSTGHVVLKLTSYSTGSVQLFDLTNGKAELIVPNEQNLKNYSHDSDVKPLSFMANHGGVSVEFLSSRGMVKVETTLNEFGVKWRGQHLNLEAGGLGQVLSAAYLETAGQEYLSTISVDGKGDRHLAIWELGKSLKPRFHTVYDGTTPFMHWLSESLHPPLLAYDPGNMSNRHLQIINAFTGDVQMTQKLPANIEKWFELGGKTYFYVYKVDGVAVFKMFTEEGTP